MLNYEFVAPRHCALARQGVTNVRAVHSQVGVSRISRLLTGRLTGALDLYPDFYARLRLATVGENS